MSFKLKAPIDPEESQGALMSMIKLLSIVYLPEYKTKIIINYVLSKYSPPDPHPPAKRPDLTQFNLERLGYHTISHVHVIPHEPHLLCSPLVIPPAGWGVLVRPESDQTRAVAVFLVRPSGSDDLTTWANGHLFHSLISTRIAVS